LTDKSKAIVQETEPGRTVDAADETTVQTPAAPTAPPFGGSLFERPKLTGDWLGLRESLRDRGITLDVSTTGYYQGVTTGGLQDGFNFGGRADYLLNVD